LVFLSSIEKRYAVSLTSLDNRFWVNNFSLSVFKPNTVSDRILFSIKDYSIKAEKGAFLAPKLM
jgi:hypothetical protein